MKKVISIIIAIGLIFPVSIDLASANTNVIVEVNNDNLTSKEEKLVKELKSNDVKSDAEIEDILQGIVKTDEKDKQEIKEELQNTEALPEVTEENVQDETLNLDDYMQENLDNGNFEGEEINDNVNIIFTNEDVFFVEIIDAEKPEMIESEDEEVAFANVPILGDISKAIQPSKTSAATKYTGKISKKYVAYSWVGLPLWEVYTKGEFKYTGSKVTPYFYDGYVKKRAGGMIWQLDNYGEGTTTNAKGTSATVFTRFNAHYGLEYSGVGVVVQYKDVRNKITCNQKGTISKSTIIR